MGGRWPYRNCEVTMRAKKKSIARRLKLTALILASVWAGFIGYYTGVFTGRDLEQIGLPGGIVWRVMFLVTIAACVVAWWRARLAGILMLSSFAVIVAYIPAIHLERWYGVFVSLAPFLVAGVILLIVWRLTRMPLETLKTNSNQLL